jgi:hypothetical protein
MHARVSCGAVGQHDPDYNLGRDMVRRYIESRGGTPDRPERRWEGFAALRSSPRLPSGLN